MLPSTSESLHSRTGLIILRPEEEMSREKALQTVMAGQAAENLLDFDAEDPAPATGLDSLAAGGPSGATGRSGVITSQAIASAAKASNPLDELMDLFSTASMQTPAQAPGAPAVGLDDLVGGSASQSPALGPAPQVSKQAQAAPAKQEDDLLGLF